LVVLMAARLGLALVSLGIALAVDSTLDEIGDPGRVGLYTTVASAFLATVLMGVLLPRIRRPQGFGALNIAADIAIVSALVHFSGGPDSLFGFLYVVVALYSALLFERRGVLLAAGLGIASYGAVLLAASMGRGGEDGLSSAVLWAVWGFHGAAITIGAALASTLAHALRQRTRAFEHLASLHRHTVESLMSGLLTTDADGRITSFNPEAERITGLTAGVAQGRALADVLPGCEVHRETPGAVAMGERYRMPFCAPDGSDRHLGVGSYVLRDGEGRASGRVVIFQDVSVVVAMEVELRRSERLAAVGELSASIAHEIRNPLAAIAGSIQILQSERGDVAADSRGRLMEIVLRETDRLDALIGGFLRYARPGPIKPELVVVRRAVEDLAEMLAKALPEGIRLELDVPEALAVEADPDQLRQVLWNLCLNAWQAMPGGGEIRIEVGAGAAPQEGPGEGRNRGDEEGWVEICVRDAGTGMPPEVLEHVFDPFFTTKTEGSGLGLAIVHRIIEEHGGSIRVESGENCGTAVRIGLPRAEART
jgi:two-component system sensor histidine kinase PilS (NtrC family)